MSLARARQLSMTKRGVSLSSGRALIGQVQNTLTAAEKLKATVSQLSSKVKDPGMQADLKKAASHFAQAADLLERVVIDLSDDH